MPLVALEGMDGVGKTTQIELLAAAAASEGWNGPPALFLHEPGGTELGEWIRGILKGEIPMHEEITDRAELLLFSAARAQLIDRVIRPALGRGELVVTDRFTVSSLAYQAHGRGLPIGLVGELTKIATGGLEADCVMLISLPPDERRRRATMRSTSDRIEKAGEEFFERVERGYASIADDDTTEKIDGRGTPEDVHHRVLEALRRRGIIPDMPHPAHP